MPVKWLSGYAHPGSDTQTKAWGVRVGKNSHGRHCNQTSFPMVNVFPGDCEDRIIIFNISIQTDPLYPVEFPQLFSVSYFLLFLLGMSSQITSTLSLKNDVFLHFSCPGLRIILFLFPELFSQGFRLSSRTPRSLCLSNHSLGSSLWNKCNFLNWILWEIILQAILGTLCNGAIATWGPAVNYLSN